MVMQNTNRSDNMFAVYFSRKNLKLREHPYNFYVIEKVN